MALDEPEINEKPFTVNGLEVLISDNLKGFMEGTVVDFISSPYGDMFTVENDLTGC